MSKIASYAGASASEVETLTLRSFCQGLGRVADGTITVEKAIERGVSFHPRIGVRLWGLQVEWNYGLKNSAGRFATAGAGNIELHPGLQYAKPQQMVETLLHEVAHGMQWLEYGRCNHGTSWWEMMFQLGQQPQRTHCIAECMEKFVPKTSGSLEEMGL